MPLSDYLMHVSCIAFHDIPTTIYISSERGDAGEPDVKLCLSSTVPKTTSTEAPTDPIKQTTTKKPLYKWRASTSLFVLVLRDASLDPASSTRQRI